MVYDRFLKTRWLRIFLHAAMRRLSILAVWAVLGAPPPIAENDPTCCNALDGSWSERKNQSVNFFLKH